MQIESVKDSSQFSLWYTKLNRKLGVSIYEILNMWLEEENRTVAQDASSYAALLNKAREMAGEKKRVTRAQCQMLTKEFDPKYAENSRLVELNDILTKLFKEWGSKETDDVPYLYLLIMWIETRDFRREKEEEVMPDRDRQRRGSIPFAQRKNSNAGVSLLPNQLHREATM